jgi:hypothetical protein
VVDHIKIAPATQSIVAGGTSSAYTAKGYDAYGNHWDITAETTFSIGDGSCDNTAKTCTSTLAGNRTVTGAYEGRTDTAKLTVTPAELDHITVKPNKTTIIAGETSGAYSSTAYDAYGNHWDITAETTFSIDDGICDNTAETCTSTLAGNRTVTGAYEGMTDTAVLEIDPAALDHIVIKPNKVTVTAGDSASYTAKGYDAYGNHWDITADTTFTVDGSGSCAGATCTSTDAGRHTVTGTYEGMTDTAVLEIDPGPLASITISPDPSTIAAGDTQGYTAEGFDQYGNNLGDVTADTVFTISVGGSCSGTDCGSNTADSYTVTGTVDGTGISDNATLNVTALVDVDHIVISPDTAAIPAGGSQPYTAEAFDQYGNNLGDVTADTVFTIDGGGSCTGAICTSTAVATHTVTGTYVGKTDTATLAVSSIGTPVLVVSPNPVTVQVGHTQAFTALLYDGYGNLIADVTADVTFTIDAPGTCTAHVCGSAVAGTYTITATLNPPALDSGVGAADADPEPVIGTATLIVTAAPATAAPSIVVGGATGTPRAATPPPTNTSDGPNGSAPMPLFVLLMCSAFGALGLLVVQAERRTIRR